MRYASEMDIYLSHFLPHISVMNVITHYLVYPTSIIINIAFILYNLLQVWVYNGFDSYMNSESLDFSNHVITMVEACGVFLIILFSLFYWCKGNYAMMIDCIRYIGTWSTFQLFYQMRPSKLMKNLKIMYTHDKNHIQKYRLKKHRKICRKLEFYYNNFDDLI